LPGKELRGCCGGQPDAVLITPKFEEGKPVKAGLMDPVAFDHKAHEKYNNNCRVCHHAGMESCASCHTLAAPKKAAW